MADTKNKEIAESLMAKSYLTINDLQKSEIWGQLLPFSALGITNARQLLYHFLNDTMVIPACECGTNLSWHTDKRTYRAFCSKKCTATFSVHNKKKDNLKKYGVEWHTQLPGWSDKVKETSLNKFGVEHYSQTGEFLERVESTNQRTRGVKHVMQDKTVKDAVAETCHIKYGTKSPLQSLAVKEKIKNANLKRYGVENPLQSSEIRDKIAITNLEKYGVSHAMQNYDVANKAATTRKENYYDPEVLRKLTDAGWLYYQNSTKTIHEIAGELNISASNLAKYYHKNNIEIQYHTVTSQERKMYDYFAEKGVSIQLKNRTIIKPKEIDIYFPDANFGVEINGGYWHSEQFQPDANAQLNKITLAAAAGVELWHFWDWEINDNWNIVISKIEHRLGLSRKVHARKLTIGEVPKQEVAAFLVANHLQGACPSKINLGLYDSDSNLVMVATFGASRFTAKYRWELLRMAAAKGVGVVGGAARLLSHFKKAYMKSSETLVSYCQRRFSQGNVYNQIGFVLRHTTGPGYQYVKSGLPAGSRNCWQKHMMAAKLPNFDPTITGDCNMRNAGYYRAWDCGQWVFTLSI